MRKLAFILLYIVFVFFVFFSFLSPPLWAGEMNKIIPSATVEKNVFDARGTNETILHVTRQGRYAIHVTSPQGTEIEIIDRMSGRLLSAGSAGKKDGRFDILLEKGKYKIKLFSHPNGSGLANLEITPFQKAENMENPAEFPFLLPLKPVYRSLNDFQQYDTWIHIKKTNPATGMHGPKPEKCPPVARRHMDGRYRSHGLYRDGL